MDKPRWIGGRVKGIHLAVVAFVLSLLAALIVIVGGAYLLTVKSDEGSETHDAICALAGDLERRTGEARVFLREHPDGLPGIASASQIRESTQNQEQTLKALSVVDC